MSRKSSRPPTGPDPQQPDLFDTTPIAEPTRPDSALQSSAAAPEATPVASASAPAPAREPGPMDRLADGFAQQVERWSRAAGAAEATAAAAGTAARALSLAIADGHVCLSLDALASAAAMTSAERPQGPAGWRAALLASGVVDDAAAPGACPLVLDREGRLYLARDLAHERALAARLVAAARSPASALDIERVHAQLQALFPGRATRPAGSVDWQQVGAAMAVRGRLTVISGGPGTGKTTTVVALLACLLAQDAGCRIALAAPTGKAAARMTDAIRQRATTLPEDLRALLPAEASTVHRLLGVLPEGRGFRNDAANPLPVDVLVVDEASMLDLALAARLLDAVPPGARLVLLGDKDQLAAVESGAVFAELSADPRLSERGRAALAALCDVEPAALQPPAPARESVLRDSVVWFTQNFRFGADSPIGRLATDIRLGRAGAALDTLRDAAGDASALHWIDDDGDTPLPATHEAVRAGYAAYVEAVRAAPQDVAAWMPAYDRFRVLCALRQGPRGAEGLNAWWTLQVRAPLSAALPPGIVDDPRSPWYPGRPVMVLRNDPVQRLYNGDVGLAARDDGGDWRVWFPSPEGGLRAVAAARLPAHQTAWAMTVHKSQGSEFDAVLVLMPARPGRIATRELLYTAVTRAKQRVVLAASAPVLRQAVATPTQRASGLLARLQEAADVADGSPTGD